MERIALLLACAALTAACSTPPGPQAAASEQHCTTEPRIGSSIPSTKCVSHASRHEDKRDAQEIADTIRRAPTRSSSAGAGN